MLGHRDQCAVRQHELGVGTEALDEAEDVVPAAAVQTGRVLAQLVEDLVHLERGGDRLDQHGRADRAAGEARALLRRDEDVVPQPCLEVALELRQVEVGAGAPRRTSSCALWNRSRGRSRTATRTSARRRAARVSRPGASPAAGPSTWRSRSFSAVVLASRGAGEGDRAAHGVAQVDLALDPRCDQVGALESSKSAMKTLAPEFSALMTILRSTGPVISTRRSSRSPAGGAIFQSASRTAAVSVRKSGRSPASNRCCRSIRDCRKARRRGSNSRTSRWTKCSACGVSTSAYASLTGPTTRRPSGGQGWL